MKDVIFTNDDITTIGNMLGIAPKPNFKNRNNTICVWRFGDKNTIPSNRAEVVLKKYSIELYVGEETPAYNTVNKIGQHYKTDHLKHSPFETALRFYSLQSAEPILIALSKSFHNTDSSASDIYQSNNNYIIDIDTETIQALERELSAEGIKSSTRDQIIKARINQSIFRDSLLQRHKKCCLCGVTNPNLLIASHIKPWSISDNKERVNVNNGLILCPNHDKLFDGGWITFDDNGNIMISNQLSENDRVFMNIRAGMNITITPENRAFMEYHRNNIYKG